VNLHRVRFSSVALGLLLGGLTFVYWRVLRHAVTSYDLEFHIAWGRELAHGHLPAIDHPAGPTEHPLVLLLTTLADLAPWVAPDQALHAFAYVAYASLTVAVLTFGAELFSWGAGAIAALIVGFCSPLAETTAIATPDVAATALVIGGALILARGTARPARPFALFALAGLIRPEIWLLSGAALIWQFPKIGTRERVKLTLLVVAAPAIWAGLDLITTGDPMFSFTETRDHAAAAHRTTGARRAPHELIDDLVLMLGRVVVYGGAAGAVAAAVLSGPLRGQTRSDRPRHPATAVLVGMFAVTAISFMALGIGRQPLLERYLFIPACALAIFFGFAATIAWHLSPRRAAALAALTGAAMLIVAAHAVAGHRDRTRASLAIYRDQWRAARGLEDMVNGVAAAPLGRCHNLGVVPYNVRPYLANDLHRPLASIQTRRPFSRRVAVVSPATRRIQDLFLILLNRHATSVPPVPAGYHLSATSGGWRLLARRC
jgi:hypothetical protein